MSRPISVHQVSRNAVARSFNERLKESLQFYSAEKFAERVAVID
jgi:hypothetical protein